MHRRVIPEVTEDFGRLAGLIDGELSSQEADQAVPVGPALPTLDEPEPTTGPVQPAPERGDGLLPYGGRLAGMPAQRNGEGLPDAPDLPDEADAEHDADQLRWQQIASRLAAWQGQMLSGPFVSEDMVAAPEGADLDAALLFAGRGARRYLRSVASPKVHRRMIPELTEDFGRLAGLIDGELSSQEADQAVPVGPAPPSYGQQPSGPSSTTDTRPRGRPALHLVNDRY